MPNWTIGMVKAFLGGIATSIPFSVLGAVVEPINPAYTPLLLGAAGFALAFSYAVMEAIAKDEREQREAAEE